mmetsp:Transcript_10272/g.15293  ORF Transcript_10272/g.15293 Transcript_10272/m.15293 type:complete len:80 (-) Transcript_10272:241-480(-)
MAGCGKRNYFAALMWIVLLWFIVWPVAAFCAGIWVLIQPFEAFFPFLKGASNFLEKLITWPRDTGKAIADCSSTCPTPW